VDGLSSGLALFLVVTSISVFFLCFRNIWKGNDLTPLIEGNNLDSTIGRYWSIIVMGRWIIVSLVLVVLKDYSCI